MKKFFCFICLAYLSFPMKAQEALSLDSCRALAISNNKELLISQEKINAAHYQRKAAFTNYLPNISASGGYMRSQKELSILSDAQKGALSGLGTSLSGPLQQAAQVIAQLHPELAGQLPALGQSLVGALDGAGQSLVDAFRTDTRNMYAGALTLTPIYGRQDTCLQQNYQIRRRAGPPAAQHRYAGSNPEYRPGILAGSVPCP